LSAAQNGVVLEPQLAKTHRSCQSADKLAERGYYDESDVFLCEK